MTDRGIETVTCHIKVLHRWTASSKTPSKMPVKDWCKEKKQRWFVANFCIVPSQTTIRYYHKKEDWRPNSKNSGTLINLADIVSARMLPRKEDEHRIEINLETYSALLVFENLQSADTTYRLLKSALRTFHVKLERCPDLNLTREYTIYVDNDHLEVKYISTNAAAFTWDFAHIKGFQFKSDLGHTIITVSNNNFTPCGNYSFSGERVFKMAKKLKDMMSVEERYQTLPIQGLERPPYGMPVYDLPHESGMGMQHGYPMQANYRGVPMHSHHPLMHKKSHSPVSPLGFQGSGHMQPTHNFSNHQLPGLRMETENIYEDINDFSASPTDKFMDKRSPVPLPPSRNSFGRNSVGESIEWSPCPSSEEDEERSKQLQVEEALKKLSTGEVDVAEDGGYVPINQVITEKKTGGDTIEKLIEEGAYIQMLPPREMPK